MEISLDRVSPGMRAVVTQIPDFIPIKQRLREFGFVPGTELCCRFLSPDGALAALEFLGTVVAVRTSDLQGILVRREP